MDIQITAFIIGFIIAIPTDYYIKYCKRMEESITWIYIKAICLFLILFQVFMGIIIQIFYKGM
jgi:hypothetical protein